MAERRFADEVAELFELGLVLCDLLGEDPPAVLASYRPLEEAVEVGRRDRLSPEASHALRALEAFIAGGRDHFGTAFDDRLLQRVDAAQQRLLLASMSTEQQPAAQYWRSLLQGHHLTGHPELARVVGEAEAYLDGLG